MCAAPASLCAALDCLAWDSSTITRITFTTFYCYLELCVVAIKSMCHKWLFNKAMSDIKNAVINGVLCYLSSARHTLTDQAMCTICLSFYNSDKISEAKELLFKIGNETTVKRRGEAKSKADLMDIINLLRKLDENRANVPKFVADNFCTMPPASGFETIAEHIINLTMEISTLKNEIQNLKDEPSGNSLG